jgi:PTS system nitrogen regulatory IIA component
MHFGAALRILRADAGISLTELARSLGVSPAYLSRVEHGHDAAPTPDRVVAIARALDVPPLVLLEIAQGAGAALAGYLERVPEASTLFLEMARRDFGAAEIARIKVYIDRELPRREVGGRQVRLGDLLTADRVLVQVVAQDLEDVVVLAATRLVSDHRAAKALAARILEREEDTPSLLGKGVAVPHAIVTDTPAAGALVTLARPLKMRTPDGEPIRAVIVLVAPNAGRRQVQLLAHVARLAVRGLAEVLADARTPERALGRLEALDVS